MPNNDPWDESSKRNSSTPIIVAVLICFVIVCICATVIICISITNSANSNTAELNVLASAPVAVTESSIPETTNSTEYINPYMAVEARHNALKTAAENDALYGPDSYQGTNWWLTEGGYTEEELFGPDTPDNGYILVDIGLDKLAPLSVTNRSEKDCVFVLKAISVNLEGAGKGKSEWYNQLLQSGKLTYKFYIHAYESVELSVPLGKYVPYYAIGDNWYGNEYLFGLNTEYYKCESTLTFSKSGSSCSGHSIELQPVLNGNLKTAQIDVSEFP